MKLTITTTYKAKKIKVEDLLKIGYGDFIETVNECPSSVYANIYYLSSLNKKRMVYHLTDMEESAVLE